MKRSWIILVVVGVACKGSSSATGPTSIDGTWSYSATVSNTGLSVSCTATGQAIMSQSGSQFTGTSNGNETCAGPGGTSSNTYTAHITGGQVSGTQVSFADDAGCSYTGSLSGSPTNRLSGSVNCTYAVSGQNYTFLGTWLATR